MSKKGTNSYKPWLYFWGFIWLILIAWVLCTAIAGNYEDPSGWWQVAIEMLGFPIIFYGLYELRKKIIDQQWEPELDVGVAPSDAKPNQDTHLQQSTIIVIRPDYRFSFWVIVRNSGKLASRSTKILIENESFEDIPLQLGFSNFSPDSATEYSLPRGLEDKFISIFSGYDACFWCQVKDFPQDRRLPWEMQLRCRIWADGLGNVVDKKLSLSIQKEHDVVGEQFKASSRGQPHNPA